MDSKYLLSFKEVQGNVEFTYNSAGLLIAYTLSAELTEAQLIYMLKRIPRDVVDLKVFTPPTFTVAQITQDLGFDAFWEAYKKKIHPHKCEPLWKKLTDGKKIAALNALPGYDAYLTRTGIAKVNPQRYITDKYWLTDWKKEI